jgi:hypothetical protein
MTFLRTDGIRARGVGRERRGMTDPRKIFCYTGLGDTVSAKKRARGQKQRRQR